MVLFYSFILWFYCYYSPSIQLLFSYYSLSLNNIFSTPELPTLEQGTLLDVEEVLTTVSKVVLAVLLPELDDVSNCYCNCLRIHMHAPNGRPSHVHATMTLCACYYSRIMLNSNCLLLFKKLFPLNYLKVLAACHNTIHNCWLVNCESNGLINSYYCIGNGDGHTWTVKCRVASINNLVHLRLPGGVTLTIRW